MIFRGMCPEHGECWNTEAKCLECQAEIEASVIVKDANETYPESVTNTPFTVTEEAKFEIPSPAQGTKHDQEKVRLELLSTIAMTEIAKVLTFGAKKYDSHNWRKGIAWSRLVGAALRHIFSFLQGEDKDPESGLSHLAHAGCCIMFLLEHEVTHKKLDDRYKVSQDITKE